MAYYLKQKLARDTYTRTLHNERIASSTVGLIM